MKWPGHAAIGAAVGMVAACAPDIALLTFGWQRRWAGEQDIRVRAHRLLHDPGYMIPAAVFAAWCSHVIVDTYSQHRQAP